MCDFTCRGLGGLGIRNLGVFGLLTELYYAVICFALPHAKERLLYMYTLIQFIIYLRICISRCTWL